MSLGKCIQVVRSCETAKHALVAVQYLRLAYNGGHITASDRYDLLEELEAKAINDFTPVLSIIRKSLESVGHLRKRAY